MRDRGVVKERPAVIHEELPVPGGPAPTYPEQALRLETVHQLTPSLQESIDRIARAARDEDGVAPFGEHKWLRLVRGDDRTAAILLWRGENLVGAAHCDAYHTLAPDRPCRLTAEIVIDPANRRRGLGALLLRGVVALGREEYADELHLWSYGNLPAARGVALANGFRVERTLLQMALPSKDFPPRPAVSADIRLRPFDPTQDADSWLALHNRTFAGHPEQESWTPADLRARMEQSWFNPADLLLLEDAAGNMLGFCWVKLPVDRAAPGEIYIVGADPSARGRGFGELLTRAGLAHIQAAGRSAAMLYVEATNAPAIRLYRRLGFVQDWEHVCYSRPLIRPSSDSRN